MEATRDDVIACYRHILGRDPENEETLSRLVGWDFWTLVRRFAHSDEHRANISKLSSYSLLKFRSTNYLARNTDAAVRLSSVVYNYNALRERLDPERFLTLMEEGLRVVEGVGGCPDLTVDASVFGGPVPEGEVSLIASLAGRRVAVLTFTVVPGGEFGLVCPAAILVSRLQGYRGAGADVAAVTRALDVAPPLMLMAVLEGVADAFGIRDVLAVEARNHPDFRPEEAERMERAYDALFATLGAERHTPGFYHLAMPRTDASLEKTAGTHRTRSRKRRAARRTITDQARARWSTYLRVASAPQVVRAVSASPIIRTYVPSSLAQLWASLRQALRKSVFAHE